MGSEFEISWGLFILLEGCIMSSVWLSGQLWLGFTNPFKQRKGKTIFPIGTPQKGIIGEWGLLNSQNIVFIQEEVIYGQSSPNLQIVKIIFFKGKLLHNNILWEASRKVWFWKEIAKEATEVGLYWLASACPNVPPPKMLKSLAFKKPWNIENRKNSLS